MHCSNRHPPPMDQASDIRMLIDAMYSFDALHHMRSGTGSERRKSFLLQVLEALASIPLFGSPEQAGSSGSGMQLGGFPRVHCCWDHATGGPCCQSADESAERVAIAHINFHASTAFDKPSLSRFTHVGKARKRLIMGMASERLFLSAAAFAARRSVDPSCVGMPTVPALDARADEVGAGNADMQLVHRTRCSRLCEWLGSRRFYFVLPVAEAVESHIEKLQYCFFGRDKKHSSVGEMLHKQNSPIGESLAGLWSLLCQWTPAKDGPWRVLSLSGWRDSRDEEVRLCARAHAVGLSAGVVLRYDKAYSALPWSLHRLVADEWGMESKRALCAELMRLHSEAPCCLPYFAKNFVEAFPSVDQMLSAQASCTIKVWAAGKKVHNEVQRVGARLGAQGARPSECPREVVCTALAAQPLEQMQGRVRRERWPGPGGGVGLPEVQEAPSANGGPSDSRSVCRVVPAGGPRASMLEGCAGGLGRSGPHTVAAIPGATAGAASVAHATCACPRRR